jgi:hypothetical protein
MNDERLVLVGAMRLLGASDREIEEGCAKRGFGLTRRSIPALLRALERSGRITPLRERLIHWTGDNAEASALVLSQLLGRAADGQVSIELAAMLKAVGTVACFAVEKHQLLTGQATERIETVSDAGRAEIERWMAEVRDVSPANDSESAQIPTIHAPIMVGLVDDPHTDTSTPTLRTGSSAQVDPIRPGGGGITGPGASDFSDGSSGS